MLELSPLFFFGDFWFLSSNGTIPALSSPSAVELQFWQKLGAEEVGL